MTDKALILQAVQEMPDDAPLQTISDKVEFIRSVREGIEQADRDEGISLEEWSKKIGPWSTE